MSNPDQRAEWGEHMLKFLLEWAPKLNPKTFDAEEYKNLSYEELSERYDAANDYIEDKICGEPMPGEES